MNDIEYDRDANDQVLLTTELSDDALEVAAGAARGLMVTGVVFCTGLDSCPA
jgi:hypothetical protein